MSVVSTRLKTDAKLSICAGSDVFLKKKKISFLIDEIEQGKKGDDEDSMNRACVCTI